ncbi:MAG: hypothetical protein ACLFTA_01190 [Candidatus Nanohaloarchaea archaeon]
MGKVTFREDEEVLKHASELWSSEDAVFGTKSDFYRFAGELALTELLENYEPSDDFSDNLENLDEIKGVEAAVAAASDPYFEAFDYANSMVRILENDEAPGDQRIEEALEMTYEFILSEFSGSYTAQGLE